MLDRLSVSRYCAASQLHHPELLRTGRVCCSANRTCFFAARKLLSYSVRGFFMALEDYFSGYATMYAVTRDRSSANNNTTRGSLESHDWPRPGDVLERARCSSSFVIDIQLAYLHCRSRYGPLPVVCTICGGSGRLLKRKKIAAPRE